MISDSVVRHSVVWYERGVGGGGDRDADLLTLLRGSGRRRAEGGAGSRKSSEQ